MKKPIVIAVTGLARHGKDTVANRLVSHHGFVRDAFADDLKLAALALDPCVEVVNGHSRLSEVVEQLGWEAAKALPDVRRLLQRLGSEAGWMAHHRLLWVDHVAARIEAADDGRAGTVIPDLRFPHEQEWLRSVGGALVKVHRPGMQGTSGEQAAHRSEAWMERLVPDTVLVNDGSLEDLHSRVDQLAQALLAP